MQDANEQTPSLLILLKKKKLSSWKLSSNFTFLSDTAMVFFTAREKLIKETESAPQ